MKTNLVNLLAISALLFTSSFAFAQEKTTDYMVGDTIKIKKDAQTYLTGERPSSWVYGREFTIQQVGTRRFPDGLLLKGIYSWIAPKDVELTGAVERPAEENPAQEQNATPAAEGTSDNANNEMSEGSQPDANATDTIASEATDVAPAEPAVVKKDENPNLYVMDQKPAEHSLLYPFHRFSIGVRGGVASLMQKSDVMGNWRAGFDALLDLQYAYYFGAPQGKKVNMGIMTGVSLGWAQSGLKSAIDTAYTVSTDNGDIDYTISAEQAKENNGQLQVEIPLMFTLVTEKGLFFNVGPRFIIPAYAHYNQKLTDPSINAYFQEEGVNVSNEVITGRLQDNQLKTKGKWNASKVNITLSAELGYEWLLSSGNSVGLGVYANYAVWSHYKNGAQSDLKSLISVAPPSAAAPADVDVFSASDTYLKGLGYFDCGLKVSYNFNFFKKSKL